MNLRWPGSHRGYSIIASSDTVASKLSKIFNTSSLFNTYP